MYLLRLYTTQRGSEALEIKSEPLPGLGEHLHDVGKVRLPGGRINYFLDRNAEERQGEEKDEHPENEFEHERFHYTTDGTRC